jgi:hypothetical protein
MKAEVVNFEDKTIRLTAETPEEDEILKCLFESNARVWGRGNNMTIMSDPSTAGLKILMFNDEEIKFIMNAINLYNSNTASMNMKIKLLAEFIDAM